MKTVQLLGLGLVSLLSVNCAAIHPKVQFTSFGEADPDRDNRVVEQFRGQRDQAPPAAETVKVLIDTIPEGLELKDGKISVKEGYQHELIGKVSLLPGSGMGMTGLFGFTDYVSSWRKPYCYPQVFLNYLTIFIWSTMVPLSYPCWGGYKVTKSQAIANARRAALAAGGDLVLGGYLGQGISGDNTYVTGFAGFILRMDPRLKNTKLKLQQKQISAPQLEI